MNLSILTFSLSIFLLAQLPAQEHILFSSSRQGNSDIFMMNADGSHITQLTHDDTEEWGPSWIDHQQISFLRQYDDNISRIGLNLVSGEEFDLPHPANCRLDDKNMLYAPNQKHGVYSCMNDIFLIQLETGEITNLTKDLTGTALYPAWDTGGDQILFTSNHLGTNDLFLFDIGSKAIAQLTDSPANNERGDLSPDGLLLAYSSDHFSPGNQDIVVKNLDNGTITNISNSVGTELIARFSGDNQTVFYGSNQDGNWEIYSFDWGSKTTKRLTTDPAFDGDPRILKR